MAGSSSQDSPGCEGGGDPPPPLRVFGAREGRAESGSQPAFSESGPKKEVSRPCKVGAVGTTGLSLCNESLQLVMAHLRLESSRAGV